MILRGWLAHELSIEDAGTPVGRTLDLETAYRQLLVLRLAVGRRSLLFCPEIDKPALFRSEALPFGGGAGVFGFSRHARCYRPWRWFLQVKIA